MKSLTILLFATACLALHPHRLVEKRASFGRRQNLQVGDNCGAVTGNPDDIVCQISGDQEVACAPVCCTQNGVFVDGCPVDTTCQADSTGRLVGCCPIGKTCTGVPTACVNAGSFAPSPTTICPISTPICVTQSAGVIECTGSFGDYTPPATTITTTTSSRVITTTSTAIPTSTSSTVYSASATTTSTPAPVFYSSSSAASETTSTSKATTTETSTVVVVPSGNATSTIAPPPPSSGADTARMFSMSLLVMMIVAIKFMVL